MSNLYVLFIFQNEINISCKKFIGVAILIFSQLATIYIPQNYRKCTCPGFDPVTTLSTKTTSVSFYQ